MVVLKDKYNNKFVKTEIGPIPHDWKVKKIKDIAKVNAYSLTNDTTKNYEFYYYDISSVNKGKISHPQKKIKYVNAPSRAKRIFKKNDVLMSTVRPNLKGFALIDFEAKDCVCSTGFAVISAKLKSDAMFLYQNLYSHIITNQINRLIAGSNYPAINSRDVENLKIPFPNKTNEREKIAKILHTWDKAIELKEKLIEQKKELKKGLMQKLLTGEVRLPGFEGKWKKTNLEKVATVIMGQSPPSKSYNETQKGVPLIQGNADCIDRKTSPTTWTTKPTKICQIGDIIMTVRAPVGIISRSLHEACIGRGVCAIRSKEFMDQDFLYYQLIFNEHRWGRFSQGSTFESINSNDIKSFKIDVPSLKEQRAISQVLLKADEELTLHKSELLRLKEQKKGLMQLLLTGKVRVKV